MLKMFIGNEMVKYDLTFNPRTLTIIRLVAEYLVRPTFPQERKVYRISSWISVTGDVFCGFYHRLKMHPKSKDSLPKPKMKGCSPSHHFSMGFSCQFLGSVCGVFFVFVA